MDSVSEISHAIVNRNLSHYAAAELVVGDPLHFIMVGSKWNYFHDRMMDPIKPLVTHYRDAAWLTVGDGKWGKEAFYFQSHGIDVLATDIDTTVLKHLERHGYIKKSEAQNLEKLTYADTSFDVVFAKETIHHLPRPFLGLYEMLRVARKAVVIIEPQDPMVVDNLVAQADGMREEYEAHVYGNKDFFYEPVGNYIYRLSRRDIEKMAFGVGRRKVAFRGLNSMNYEARLGDIDTNEQALARTLQELSRKDHFSSKGFRRFEYLMAIVFVEDELPGDLESELTGIGWDVVNLPKNPY